MFKFASRFFLIFLITTVIPLFAMFTWTHLQFESMEKSREKHFLDVGVKQLKKFSAQYLKAQESDILEKIQSSSKVSIAELKSSFKNVKILKSNELNNKKTQSYYEFISDKSSNKAELNAVTVFALNSDMVKISKPVDYEQFKPVGPFLLEVYKGNNVSKDALISIIQDSFYSSISKDKSLNGDIDKRRHLPPEMNGRPPREDFAGFNHQMEDRMPPPPPHGMEGRPPREEFAGFNPEMEDRMPPPPHEMEGRYPREEFIGYNPERDDYNHPHHPDRKNDEVMDIKPLNINVQDIFKSSNSSIVKISNNNGAVIATIVIKTVAPPKPFGPKNPIEKALGLIILSAGTILSLLIGFYVNKNFVDPLLLLSKAVKNVQKGNFTPIAIDKIKQEDILATFNDFNQMIKGLSEKEELRKSFITSLTHDLKTPLIAQERSLELISKEFEALGLKDAYELAKGIEKNNTHLLRMVNLILESYRFDSENLTISLDRVNISEIVNSCFEKLKPLSDEKNIKLINMIPPDFQEVKGDVTSLKRIFLNLLSNAIENNDSQNAIIKVEIEVIDDKVKIYVEDNGSGIAKEDLVHIFDRYYTGKSDERKIGSGLGLYVCKKLVQLHNGNISVESELSKFTRFIIELPKV